MATCARLFEHISKQIINHDVAEEPFEWPEAARDVRAALLNARHLPSWTSAGPYPIVDDGLEYLLAELHVPSTPPRGPSTTTKDELSSSFGAALRICDMVRLQYHKQSEDELFSSDYSNVLTYAVMVACGRIDQQVLLENEARMAVPRIPGAHPAMHYVCEELRIPLAAAVCAGDPESFSVGHRSGFLPEDKLIVAPMDGVTESENDSGERIWVPNSTHAFHRWRRSSMTEVCGHPFLCMASSPALKISMSAVLHQRRTWGLPQPVIGIAFSPVSPEISFVLGWYEENPRTPTFPVIHMCDLGPQLTLNLLHPRHILSAFNIILCLRGLAQDLYISANARRDILRRPTYFADQWRADSFNLWFPSEDSVTKITHWLEGCARSAGMANPIARQAFKKTMEEAQAQASGSDAASSTTEATLAATSLRALSLNTTLEHPTLSTQLSASAASRKSAADDNNMIINQWLLDRYVLMVSAALSQEKWNIFREYTTVYWPADILRFDKKRKRWTLIEGCGVVLSDDQISLFEMIFTTIGTFRAMHPNLVEKVSLSKNSTGPKAELGSYFLKALPLILETFSLLRSISSNANPNDTLNEATYRAPIDMLLMSLFSDKKHAIREDLTGWASAKAKADNAGVQANGSKVKADGSDRLECKLKLPLSYTYHRYLDQSEEVRLDWAASLYAHASLSTTTLRAWDKLFAKVKPLLACNRDDLPKETKPVEPERLEAVGKNMQQAIQAKSEVIESEALAAEQACVADVQHRMGSWRKQLDELHVFRRASAMSSTAVVDAMAYLRVPVSIPKAQLQDFALANTSYSASEVTESRSATDEAASEMQPSTSDSAKTPQQRKGGSSARPPTRSSQKTSVKQEKSVISSDFPSSSWVPDINIDGLDDDKERNPMLAEDQHYLHLPILVQEWKKPDGDIRQATNQQLLDLVSSVRFLEACGIVNFPVFGLVSDGPFLDLDVAFTDSERHRPTEQYAGPGERPVLICNRHATRFDLLNPMGMWRFATTIISINRLHVPKMLKEWEDTVKTYHELAPEDAQPDDPRWLHGWDLHHKHLPQWTVPQEDVRREIRESRLPELKTRYKDNASILSEIEIIEKVVQEKPSEKKKREKEEEEKKKQAEKEKAQAEKDRAEAEKGKAKAEKEKAKAKAKA